MNTQQMRDFNEDLLSALEVESFDELEYQMQSDLSIWASTPSRFEEMASMARSFTSPNEAVDPQYEQIPGGPAGVFEHAGEMTFVEALMSDPFHQRVITGSVEDFLHAKENYLDAVPGLWPEDYDLEAASEEKAGETEKKANKQKQHRKVAPPAQPSHQHPITQQAPGGNPGQAIGAQSGVNRVSGRIAVAGNGYGDDLVRRPPVGAPFPAGVQIGAIEILTFFPRWLHHPDVILRLFKAGASRELIAKVQLHAVNQLNYDNWQRVAGRVQKQVSVAGKLKTGMDQSSTWNNKMHLPSIPAYDDLTLDNAKGRHDFDATMPPVPAEDMKLAEIAAPVMQGGNWPSGVNDPDRLQMTKVLEYAYTNPHHNYTLADTTHIIQSQNIANPGALDHSHDVAAFQRFDTAVPTPSETAAARQKRQARQANARRSRTGQ